MSEPEKTFDAVAMMRAARDRISAEIEGMSLDEERNWLASQEIDDPFLARLRNLATKPSDPSRHFPPFLDRKGPGEGERSS